MSFSEKPFCINKDQFSIRSLSEKIRTLNKYDAMKEIERSYGLLSFEISKAPFYDITHLIATLSLIDHEAAMRFILDNREKLSNRLLKADPLEVKEFILAPYRLNRAMGTFIVIEFKDELKKYLLENINNFSLIKHGLIISSISRCSEKVAMEILGEREILTRICESIRKEKFKTEDLERIGSFFCSLMLGSEKLAEKISNRCKGEIVKRFEKRFRYATFEELGVFLSCISRVNPEIRRTISSKFGENIERIFIENFYKNSISDIRVLLEGVSFLDKGRGLKIYRKLRNEILDKLKKSEMHKVIRFLQSMKKSNIQIYRELVSNLTI